MSRSNCTVAFVGAGPTTVEHIKAFRQVEGVEIVGITNRTPQKAEQLADQFRIPMVASSIEELYSSAKPDLVVMAVYEPAIEETARRCFAHPWSVLMEKPIGLDLAAAERVVNAAKGRRVWVGLNRRAFASTRRVIEDLAHHDGLRFVHVQDQQSLETARALGHADNVVRNWMFANSIHLVDYLNVFCRGEVAHVDRVVPWAPQSPGVVIARVAYSSGDIGLYSAIWNGPGPWACTVSTPARRWELRPLESAVFQNAGERALNTTDPDPLDSSFKPGFAVQARRVVSALRGEPDLSTSLTEALRTTRLVAEIYDAS